MKKNILLLLLCLASGAVDARENAYDLLGKTLAPFVNLLVAKNKGQAVTGDLSLLEMTGLTADQAGLLIHVAMENPDKLCLSAKVMGAQATFCRNGQKFWAAPGTMLGLLLNQLPAAASGKSEKNPPNFVIQLPENQLAFLPALFQVKDEGDQSVNGETCRVLNLTLNPELARAAGKNNCSARIWVRPGSQLARIELFKPQWHVLLALDRLEFKPKLPESTWQPSAEQEADLLQIEPAKLSQLLELLPF